MLQNLTFLEYSEVKISNGIASKSCLSEAYKNYWYTKPLKT